MPPLPEVLTDRLMRVIAEAEAGVSATLDALGRTLADAVIASGNRDKALDEFRDYLKAALATG